MAFIVTFLCKHHLYLVLDHFHYPKAISEPVKQSFLIVPSLQPLATTNLLSVSKDLPILNILFK